MTRSITTTSTATGAAIAPSSTMSTSITCTTDTGTPRTMITTTSTPAWTASRQSLATTEGRGVAPRAPGAPRPGTAGMSDPTAQGALRSVVVVIRGIDEVVDQGWGP